MYKGKAAYLSRLYPRISYKTVEYSDKLDGSSPPSVFIGRFGYPKVAVGPLMAQHSGDTSMLDSPESWLGTVQTPGEIVYMRMQLVRGKQMVDVNSPLHGQKIVQALQEIALAKSSLDVEAQFSRKPRGHFFHEEVQPFGPSALLKQLRVGSSYFNRHMEKAHYDTDLKARDAVIGLYNRGVLFSSIQKAFSVGSFGVEKGRKLVPTRWSITAVDSTLSSHLLDQVRQHDTIDEFRVYESDSMNNRFVIVMMPTTWRYEWIEAFFPSIVSRRLMVFGDYERFRKKTGYSPVGGCYYSARLAVAERLNLERRQAGVFILREAYPGYIPLGVWNVRENMRLALKQQPQKFDTLSKALSYALSRLKLSLGTWLQHSTVIREEFVQRKLGDFSAGKVAAQTQ